MVTGTSFAAPVVADVRKIKTGDEVEISAGSVRGFFLTERAHRSPKFDAEVATFEASNKPNDPFSAAARTGESSHAGTISASKLNIANSRSNSGLALGED